MGTAFKCAVAISFLQLVCGCGRQPGMSPGFDGGVVPSPDAQVAPNDCYPRPDAALAPCNEVPLGACTGLPNPVTTGSGVQDPEVTWTGWEFLTVHWNTGSFEGRDLVLTAVTPQGQVLFTEELDGFSAPKVAWHHDLSMGVVTTDRGVRWLDGCGRPYGPIIEVEFTIDQGGIIWYATPAATIFPYPEGFVVATGFDGWFEPLEHNPPLSYALLGPTPAAIDWYALAEPGPWATPRHVVDADGAGSYVVASHWMGTHGKMFYVQGLDVEVMFDLDERLPAGADGYVVDVVEVSGELYVLFDGRSVEGEWGQWIIEITGPSARTWHFAAEDYAVDGMFALGDDIVLILLGMDSAGELSLARFDPDSGTGPPVDQIHLGRWAVGGNTAAVRTERGFGFAWKGHESRLNLQVFDCCTDSP